MALVLLLGRWQSWVYPLALNPDEAQVLANVLRMRHYGGNWDGSDGTTVGPLNSLVLAWPRLMGLEAGFVSARLTAAALILCNLGFLYLSLARLHTPALAVALVAPLLLFYALTAHADFVHYSSELLPLALLALANWLVMGMLRGGWMLGPAGFTLLGIVIGAVPFAKLQAAPLAALIAVLALLLPPGRPRQRLGHALACGAAAVLPGAFYLLPLLAQGQLADFWNSYIVWAGQYVRAPIRLADIWAMVQDDRVLTLALRFVFTLAACGLVLRLWQGSTLNWRTTLYAMLVTVVSLWVVKRPGNLFPHYLQLLLPFLVQLAGVTLAPAEASHNKERETWICCAIAAMVTLPSLLPIRQAELRELFNRYATPVPRALSLQGKDLLAWLPSHEHHLLVWGWMPQWYVWSGLTPATRETHSYAQIVPSDLQTYFRERFMRDLTESAPAIVIDGARGASFRFNKPTVHGMQIFPALQAMIDQRYINLSDDVTYPDCPVTYVRHDLARWLQMRWIRPAAVRVSASLDKGWPRTGSQRLTDFSLSEDTCRDYWLLPSGSLGHVDVDLSQTEPLARVMLLNTSNGRALDRATDRVAILMQSSDGRQHRRELTLRPHPSWTVLDLQPAISVTSLRIEILSFAGRGAGLNEVMLMRDTARP